MNSQENQNDAHSDPVTQGAATNELKSMAISLPLATTDSSVSNVLSTATVVSAPQNSRSVFAIQTSKGQMIIPQSGNNGPTVVHNNGSMIPKGHIIVRQKSETGVGGATNILPVQTLSGRTDKTTTLVEKVGLKRPLITSSQGGNIITKVIITKNPVSGQVQPFPVSSATQTLTLASHSSSSNAGVVVTNNATGTVSVVKQLNKSNFHQQPGSPSKTVTITSQGVVSPVKTVIANIPGTGSARFSVPVHKIPISPAKTPTKITMIPAGSKSPLKQSVSDNISVLSQALNSLAESGHLAINPGSPSKVIIKQGPPVSKQSSLLLKV